MENLIIGLIAVLCLLYLVAAVLRPEKFCPSPPDQPKSFVI